MRIISANLNGIRSAATKGFFDWLPTQGADVVCVQELKAQAADLKPEFIACDGLTGASPELPVQVNHRHPARTGHTTTAAADGRVMFPRAAMREVRRWLATSPSMTDPRACG